MKWDLGNQLNMQKLLGLFSINTIHQSRTTQIYNETKFKKTKKGASDIGTKRI